MFSSIFHNISKVFQSILNNPPKKESDKSGADKPKRKRRPRKNASERKKEKAAASAAAQTAAGAGGAPEITEEYHEPRPYLKKKMPEWTVPEFPRENPEDHLFQDYPLDPRILKAILDDLGFKKCSPIQALSMAPILAGKDVAGKAQTGTGKTAVFLIAIMQAFLKEESQRKLNQPFAMALAPTRELALQIAKDAEAMSVYTSLRTVAVYGGMDYQRQQKLLQSGCDLVVATPGRLIDYLRHGIVDLSALKVLVIDEADRMLDMGFIPDIKRIMSFTPAPEKRQTLLFSATLSHDIMNLASRWMRPGPEVLETEAEHVIADGIEEIIYACTSREKFPILLWYLHNKDCQRVIIFRNRRRDVEQLHQQLLRYDVASEMLSGDVDQKKRLRILEDFRSGKIKVIVATDVAGRGIHVDGITHVFNYDLPYEAEDYVHRIGRTARAGQKGCAVSFAGEDCAFVIPDIEEYIERSLPICQPEEEMLVMPKAVAKFTQSSESESRKPGGPRNYHRSQNSRSGSSRSFTSRPPRQYSAKKH